MNIKKIGLAILLLLSLTAFGVAFAESATKNDTATPTPTEKPGSQVQRLVADHTPEFIKQSIATSITLVENFRLDAYQASIKKEIKIQAEIDANKKQESIDPLDTNTSVSHINPFMNAWRTMEVYILKLAEAIFLNKIAFYGIALILLVLILRYIFS